GGAGPASFIGRSPSATRAGAHNVREAAAPHGDAAQLGHICSQVVERLQREGRPAAASRSVPQRRRWSR
ncbi:MAG: hypothetical protein ACXVDA_18110, partial [Ktedonobacterales bacterium]